MRKCRGTGKQKSRRRRSLPHRENSSPPGAPIGGPRATPRQGSRHLEGRRWPWRSNSRLAGVGTGAPAAGLSFLDGRSATASQWPRRLGPSMAAPLGTGGGRGATWPVIGAGGVSARGRWDPLGPSFGVSVRGTSTSPRGGPSRIRSRRDAIPSESSLSSSSSSSSLGDSSSGSPSAWI